MSAVSFHAASNTLFFVPAFFNARDTGVFVSWRTGVAAGSVIRKGQILAVAFWDDGAEDNIVSLVKGTVLRTNRRIVHEKLHMTPPQWALVLRA
jgi:hypothetical protein